MANQALIQGAYTSAPKFSEAGDAFSSAFEGRMQQFNKATEEANAKREELFSLVDNIELDDLGNTPEMTAAIMAEAKNAQNEYFEKIKNTNPFDPELRLEAVKTSQKINQLQALSATHQAFIQDVQSNKRMLSTTNGAEAYDRLKEYTNLSISKDKEGNYVYKDSKGNIIPRKELAAYNDSLIEVPTAIYSKLTDTAQNLIKPGRSFESIAPSLRQMLNSYLDDPSYGNDFLYDSLGGKSDPYDTSDLAPGLRIAKYPGETKESISKKGDISFLREQVIDGYMKAFKLVHQSAQPVQKNEATVSDINRAEKNKTRQGVISNVLSDFSNALTKTKDFNFLTSGKSIIYKGKKIKSVESGPGDKLTLVYDIGQEKEGAFDVSISDPSVINALLSSYGESNFSNFDDQAKLALKNEISKRYPKGGIIDAPPPGFDPYAAFR